MRWLLKILAVLFLLLVAYITFVKYTHIQMYEEGCVRAKIKNSPTLSLAKVKTICNIRWF